MTESQIAWLFYAFFLAVRIPANIKRCRIPMMRGPGYFFNTRVPADFYEGPGRPLLRNYRAALFLPFALDAAALPLIYSWNQPRYLFLLATADVVVSLVNYIAVAKRAIRAAKPFEIEPVPTATAVAFSLTTRRVQDYTNPWVEWSIVAINAGCLAILGRYLLEFPRVPLLLLYLQIGLLLLKRALVAGRTALPRENAEAYLEWREGYRRLFLRSCDAVRLLFSACMILVVFDVDRMYALLATAAMLIAWVIWYSRQSRRFMELHARTMPVRLPDALEPAGSAPAILCYRPDMPLSFLKGPRGYALNLANRRAQIGVLYVGGLAALFVL